jgi:hypothetical protein
MGRQNLAPNPAAKNDTAGYGGSATFARTTDFPAGCPRSTGVRLSAGGYLTTPAAACAEGDVFTVSFYGHNGGTFFEFGKTVYISYTRSSGGDAFPETFSFALGDIGNVVRGSFTTQPAPANATGIYLVWDALGPGYGMTGLLLEKTGTLQDYADGDTSGWAWDGADGNSTSSELAVLPAEGSASLTLDLAAGATGARPSDGAAALALALDPAAAGARASAGASAFALGLDPAAVGARTSGGSAALRLGLHVAASGAGEVSCLPFPWSCSAVPGFGACGDLPAFPGTCVPVPSFSEVAP